MKKRYFLLIIILSTLCFCWSKVNALETYTDYTNLLINIGADETQINISWYSKADEDCFVWFAKKSEVNDGTGVILVNTEKGSGEYYIHRETIENLEANTEYVYRIGNDNGWSEEFYYKTQNIGDNNEFSFIALGDFQTGAVDSLEDAKGLLNTIDIALDKFRDISIIISVGDQVNESYNESQYSAFINVLNPFSIPLAPTVGNHDSGSEIYNEHFFLPNLSDLGSLGEGYAGGDYYYQYNNTLFMHLNTNNTNVEEHKSFMEKAIALNPECNWNIVIFHHSLFSTADHSYDESIITLREDLAPVIKELKIDMAIMGHDHVYVRSYILGGESGLEKKKEVTNPDGVLYITLNSPSGSKFYDIAKGTFEYAAVVNQEEIPNYTVVNVSKTSLSITTYETLGNSQVDSFTIEKPIEVEKEEIEKVNNEDEVNLFIIYILVILCVLVFAISILMYFKIKKK